MLRSLKITVYSPLNLDLISVFSVSITELNTEVVSEQPNRPGKWRYDSLS